MKTPEGKTKMDKQQVLNQLRNAKEIYVIMSLCTRMPYVVCDKETFDDEVLIYFTEEDVKREGKRLVEEKIPVQIAKVDANQMLHFYGNLYTMGVNCLMVDQYMDSECRIQLPELVSRPGQNKPDTPEDEKKTWIENPSLHLTALYFMQELRRQKFETMPEELKEMQEEILADFRSRIDHGIFGYTDPDQEYFDALDHWFFTRHGYHVDRETVTVGCGVVYGLATGVKAFTKEGDAILIQQPVYYPFREVILPASGLWTRNTRTAWCCILHQAKPLTWQDFSRQTSSSRTRSSGKLTGKQMRQRATVRETLWGRLP